MPNHSFLTYGELQEKLTQLGFEENGVELDGKRGRVFEHPRIAASMIVLPERLSSDQVEPFYLVPILAMLKANDLLPEGNPLKT